MWNPQKPFNSLPPLPPKNVETPTVLKAVARARGVLGELNGAQNSIPNPGVLIDSLRLREAQSSSEIENVVTTSDELYRAFTDSSTQTDPATKEVLRYSSALRVGFNELRSHGLLTTRTFEQIVQTLRGTSEGVRRVPGTKIENKQTGEIIYTPPEGEEVIRQKLSELEIFIHREDEIDPIVRMALVHYQFEAIHPFTDGNGRAGRILNLLLLAQQNLLSIPTLYLSSYILRNRSAYYEGLRRVTSHGEWEQWVLFMVNAVHDTAVDTLGRVREIRILRESLGEEIRSRAGRAYSAELVDLLFAAPYAKISFLVERGIAKRQTASSYLRELAELGVLSELKRGRESYFLNHRLLSILQR